MSLEELEKDIEKYNKLPDQEKIGDNFRNIKNKISTQRNKIKTLVEKLNNPQNFIENDSDKEFSQEEFIDSLQKIEKIKLMIQTEKNIDDLVNMYLELYNLSTICKNYLEDKKMEIAKI